MKIERTGRVVKAAVGFFFCAVLHKVQRKHCDAWTENCLTMEGRELLSLWRLCTGRRWIWPRPKKSCISKSGECSAWGPPLLFLLLGRTGIFLTIQLRATHSTAKFVLLRFVRHSARERYSRKNRSGSFAVRIADDGTCGGNVRTSISVVVASRNGA